jgi:GNAT superfamily N-acetyltransferase
MYNIRSRSPVPDMHIRTLGSHEVGLHREVRLRALQDAPDSFGGTYDEESSRPADYWERQTEAVTEPGRNVMFLASDGDEIFGMVYGLLDRERHDGGRVGGMWVDPSARRQGTGKQLLSAVFDWSRARGLKHIGLWAPSESAPAIALYLTMGFQKTANRRPLRTGSALEVVEMTREL